MYTKLVMKKIIIISNFNYFDIRIKYLVNSLEQFKEDYLYLTSNFNHITKKKEKVFTQKTKIINTIAYKKNLSFVRVFSHAIFSIKTFIFLLKEKPKLVYLMVPPNFLLFLLLFVKTQKIIDIYDLWPESFPKTPFFSLIFRMITIFRNYSLRKADYIVLECGLFLDYFKPSNKNNISLIYPSYGNFYSIIKNLNESVHLLYLGSINHLIDINQIIRSLCLFISNSFSVHVHIIGGGESENIFINKLKSNNINHTFYGKIFDPIKKRNIASFCSFGINIYNKNAKIGFTMKSTEYFQFGLPIINNIQGDTYEFVRKYNIGVNLDDLNEITVSKVVRNRKNMSDNVKMFYNKYLDEKILIKKFESIFKKFI